MSNLDIPDWSSLGEPNCFAYKVEDINRFWIIAEFPTIAAWEDQGLRSVLQDRLHDDVTNLLRTAEFFKESRIEHSKASDHFSVKYPDDTFDFEISCYSNRIVLQKAGVRSQIFHRWYHAAIPSVKQILDSLLQVMSNRLNRNQTITGVSFNFRFITHDFQEKGKELKNYQILNRLFTYIPTETGEIGPMGDNPQGMSRLDYRVSCWDGKETGDRRRLTYSVEAPSNREYAGLWFDFAYSSETYTDPSTGRREWTEPSVLLDEYDRAYEFLWNRAMSGFMKSLLANTSFRTTPSYIP